MTSSSSCASRASHCTWTAVVDSAESTRRQIGHAFRFASPSRTWTSRVRAQRCAAVHTVHS
eukprot:9295363-Alexandrium_andersonii.AAC.1